MNEQGRGRLSCIRQMPDEAWPFIRVAEKQLAENRLPQTAIREQLNAKLRELGVDEISSSSFNRHSMRMSISGKELMRKREAMAGFVRELGDRPDTNMTLAISEFGKSLVYDMIELSHAGERELSPKDLAAVALSYQRFTQGDQKAIAAADAQVDLDEKISKKEAERIIDAAARHAGLSQKTREMMKAEILGIPQK